MRYSLRLLSVVIAWACFTVLAHASQNSIVLPTVSPYAGLTMVQNINQAFNSFASNFSGGSAPSSPVTYQSWINTTTNPAVYNVYDGSSWLALGNIDATAHAWSAVSTTQASGDNSTKVATTAFVHGAFRSVNVVRFTSSGTYTPSANMIFDEIEEVGGGGGGGGAAGGSGVACAASGSAGSYAEVFETATQIGTSQTITIGAAGAGASAGNNTGSAGGTTSVGSLLSCPGGNPGGGSGNGAATGVSTGPTNSPSPCTITTGTVIKNIAGQGSTVSLCFGGTNGNGSTMAGLGGSSPLGFGAPSQTGGTYGGYAAPAGYGAGGGGGLVSAGGSSTNGGAATGGEVIITEFIGP